MAEKTVGIIGGGAWGTGIAQALARGGHKVEIWALEEDVVSSINNEHENKRFLPGFKLEPSITCSNDIWQVAFGKEFIFVASPSIFLTQTLAKINTVPNIVDGSTVIAALTKGFVPSDNGPKLILETIESALPEVYKDCTVYVAGPSHAEEVAMGATHAETFTSVSGVGDLDVTCKSKYGRNRRFGQDLVKTDMLSRFKDIDDLIANVGKIGYLPKGAIACKYVHEIAQKKDLKLPLCNALYKVLNKESTVEQMVKELLNL